MKELKYFQITTKSVDGETQINFFDLVAAIINRKLLFLTYSSIAVIICLLNYYFISERNYSSTLDFSESKNISFSLTMQLNEDELSTFRLTSSDFLNQFKNDVNNFEEFDKIFKNLNSRYDIEGKSEDYFKKLNVSSQQIPLSKEFNHTVSF